MDFFTEASEIVSNPLVLPIVATLAMGAAAYVLSRWFPIACKLLALAAGALVLYCGAEIVSVQGHVAAGWTWVQLGGDINLQVELAKSPLGMVVMIASAAFAVLIAIYSFRAMAGEYWEGKFYTYLIWTLGGACVVALAGNLFVLLMGWELVTLMLFLMINQGRRTAQEGAAKTYGVLGFADACLVLSLALLAAMEGGTKNWSLTGGAVVVGSKGALGYASYVLILVAALAKAGAVPLHTWIPSAAKDAPAPVMALLPAALDKLLGIYLLATLCLRIFIPDWPLQVVMMVIGAVTILAAVLMAMVQHNLKRLLSFHAVSQVGYMVLGIGTGTVIGIVGGLFHMLNHAIYKSNLFLMSGAVGRAAGSDEIEDMGGLARSLPITFACGTIAAFAISGVPPLNGFVSKWLVYQGTLQTSRVSPGLASALVVAAVFGSALTLASFIKVIYSAFLSPAPKAAPYARGERRPRENVWMAAPMIVLALACIALGLWPNIAVSGMFLPALEGREGGLIATNQAIQAGELGYWSPAQATGLIVLGILGGLVLVWLAAAGTKVRVVRPFLAGEVPSPSDDRWRVPGTHFYETVARLPIIGGLLAQGEGGAMDPYYWSSKHGNTFVQMLRRLHTGLVSLYVVWVLMGLTVTLVYLLLTARTL